MLREGLEGNSKTGRLGLWCTVSCRFRWGECTEDLSVPQGGVQRVQGSYQGSSQQGVVEGLVCADGEKSLGKGVKCFQDLEFRSTGLKGLRGL